MATWRTVERKLLRSHRLPSPREGPLPKGEGKGGKGKRGASSLDKWPDGQEDQPSGERPTEEVASLFIGAVSRHERYNRRD